MAEAIISEEASSNSKHKNKYILNSELKDKLKDFPEVLQFIELLQNYIEKQRKKLNKLKSRLSKEKSVAKKCKQIGTQTSCDDLVEDSVKPNAKGIAEEIKEAAELMVQNTGMVYEETSGMYYDYNTGYYYNAEYGLYYDGKAGTYLTYNQETQTYDFYSQVATPSLPHSNKKPKRKLSRGPDKRKDAKRLNREASPSQDYEEGECSQSSWHESSSDEDQEINDISKQYPPCMRVIIESTSLTNLKQGALSIVTCQGGTIGREGDHSILIPDINASKHHLKLTFDKTSNAYQAIDLGSRNGTFLNGKRMSPSKQESEAFEVAHGSKIKIGSTVLLCHVHEGNQTCGHCEPGLIQTDEEAGVHKTKSKIARHKSELRSLRKKFGMSGYEDDAKLNKLSAGYTDRAQKRRETVGSQNPHEKTKVASVNESIPAENKGFKMLAKMGWKEGTSLGRDGEGMLEPINVVNNTGKSGIGNTDVVPEVVVNQRKQNILKKTQERFLQIPDDEELKSEEID